MPPELDAARVIALIALVSARVLPVFLIAPFFGGRLVPRTVRIAGALAIAAAIAPALVGSVAPAAGTLGPATLAALIVKEALIGLTLGFLSSLVFLAAEAAGRLIDLARGGAELDVRLPGSAPPSSPSAALLLQLTVVVFLTLDGHHAFLRALAHSYEVLPVTGLPTSSHAGAAAQAALSGAGHLLLVALALAAPVLAAVFLVELTLGLIARVSLRLDVTSVGIPVRALTATLVLMLTLVALVTVLRGELARALRNVLALLG